MSARSFAPWSLLFVPTMLGCGAQVSPETGENRIDAGSDAGSCPATRTGPCVGSVECRFTDKCKSAADAVEYYRCEPSGTLTFTRAVPCDREARPDGCPLVRPTVGTDCTPPTKVKACRYNVCDPSDGEPDWKWYYSCRYVTGDRTTWRIEGQTACSVENAAGT